MKKQKAAVLPSAILMCTVLLTVSFVVAYLVVTHATNQRIDALNSSQKVEFAGAYDHFIRNNGDTTIESDLFTYSKLEETIEGKDVKGLIAKNKAGTMTFYAIYDFTSHKTLAYQTEDFYIVTVNETSYLGGILEMR